SSPIFARASVSSRSSGSLRVLSPRLPCSRKIRFQLSSSWAGTWLSRDTASSASPRSSRRTSSAFRWMLHRSGSSTSFGGLDGSDGAAGFLGFLPMSGLLGHGHPSQLRVPRNRVRFKELTALPQPAAVAPLDRGRLIRELHSQAEDMRGLLRSQPEQAREA